MIARAGGGFERAPVNDPDLAAVVADHTRSLEPSCAFGDRGAAHAQNLSKELVREVKLIGSHPIVHGEQPACASLVDQVQPAT